MVGRAKFHCELPDKSEGCIAVKEERHRNIMSRRRGLKSPGQVRVARFINSLAHKEITVESYTDAVKSRSACS